MNQESGVNINGLFVTFAEIRADVRAAQARGMTNKYAFTPETVEALLDYIRETNDVFTGEGGFLTQEEADTFDMFENARRAMYE